MYRLAGTQQRNIWHDVDGERGEDPDGFRGPDSGNVGRGETGETQCVPGAHKLRTMCVCTEGKQWYCLVVEIF